MDIARFLQFFSQGEKSDAQLKVIHDMTLIQSETPPNWYESGLRLEFATTKIETVFYMGGLT